MRAISYSFWDQTSWVGSINNIYFKYKSIIAKGLLYFYLDYNSLLPINCPEKVKKTWSKYGLYKKASKIKLLPRLSSLL